MNSSQEYRKWVRDHRFWYRVVGQGTARLLLAVEEPNEYMQGIVVWRLLAYGGVSLPDTDSVTEGWSSTLKEAKRAVEEAAKAYHNIHVGQMRLTGGE
jgi:hypothetical protein